MLALTMAVMCTVIVIVAGILWRADRISDLAVTNVIVGLVPVVGIAYVLLNGAAPIVLVLVAIPSLLASVKLHKPILEVTREQTELRHRDRRT